LLESQDAAKLTDFDLVAGAMTTGGARTGGMGTIVYSAPEQLGDARKVSDESSKMGSPSSKLLLVEKSALSCMK